MRITGGTYRSRSLEAPRGHATRPTSDRVREALFGILSSRGAVAGARVLDLYAGTGALALEALSRGAESAVLVEKAKDALSAIRTNVNALGVGDRVRVVASSVERALSALNPPFDLVFADPPYADVESGEALRALSSIVAAGMLAKDAVFVLEHAPDRGKRAAAAEGPTLPGVVGLVREETRRYGDTCLTFFTLPEEQVKG